MCVSSRCLGWASSPGLGRNATSAARLFIGQRGRVERKIFHLCCPPTRGFSFLPSNGPKIGPQCAWLHLPSHMIMPHPLCRSVGAFAAVILGTKRTVRVQNTAPSSSSIWPQVGSRGRGMLCAFQARAVNQASQGQSSSGRRAHFVS